MRAVVRHAASTRHANVFFRIIALGLFTLALAPLFLLQTRFVSLQDSTASMSIPHAAQKNILLNDMVQSLPSHVLASTVVKTASLAQASVSEARNSPAQMADSHLSALSEAASSHRWIDGCYHEEHSSVEGAHNDRATAAGAGIRRNLTLSLPLNRQSPPSGIVVVLATATDDPRVNRDTFRRICTVFPTQVEYFLEPQGLDMLFIIQEEWGWTAQSLLSCLKLYAVAPTSLNIERSTNKTWTNLDGSTLTATPHYYDKSRNMVNRKATIYVATTTTSYPKYIQDDPSVLQQPITPKSCEAPRKYIQATRWYTNEMLHLGILKEYDYFLKVDTDIIFVDSIPFHLLQDLRVKGALFGHTAEYHPRGSKTCTQGIHLAVRNFTASERTKRNIRTSSWKGTHCSLAPELEGDVDFYYTNFIIGKVSFWQSPWVLKFTRFLSEHRQGFFSYRWTDQIFWHNAMGLFLRNYSDYVVDYTNLRCMPDPNCWFSSYNFQRYGQDAWHRCDNRGYFLHPKDYRLSTQISKKKVSRQSRVMNASSQPLFLSTYNKDCSATKQGKHT
jgi:Glycolipid 2-alpha-mannosyltransferase